MSTNSGGERLDLPPTVAFSSLKIRCDCPGVGEVLIAQAGQYAEHLGRIDLVWDGEKLGVTQAAALPVADTTPPSHRILAEADIIEAEVEGYLDEVIGELVAPLDFATDRECGVANLLADALRQRMDADSPVFP